MRMPPAIKRQLEAQRWLVVVLRQLRTEPAGPCRDELRHIQRVLVARITKAAP